MDHTSYTDEYLRGILLETKSIAIVGASDDPARPSYEVLQFLLKRGYAMSAINPKLAGQTLIGAPVYGSLAEASQPIGIVDVFRNNAAVPGVIDEVLALPQRPAVVWMQLGVRDDEAAQRAEAAGIKVVMDRCPKIEILRLLD